MITKTIHYVWLGDRPKTKKVEKCINSWKRFCPSYEIREWNEQNFDINQHEFIKKAYELKKYAFASDLIRLFVLYKYGGVYVDADVEFVREIDELLDNQAFIGFENDLYVNSGQIFGSVQNNPLILEHIHQYDSICLEKTTNISSITCPRIFTALLLKKGLVQDGSEQTVEGLHIYPQDYFNPFDTQTGRMKKTENTFSIHWSEHSWATQSPIRRKLVQICHYLFGVHCFDWLKKLLNR